MVHFPISSYLFELIQHMCEPDTSVLMVWLPVETTHWYPVIWRQICHTENSRKKYIDRSFPSISFCSGDALLAPPMSKNVPFLPKKCQTYCSILEKQQFRNIIFLIGHWTLSFKSHQSWQIWPGQSLLVSRLNIGNANHIKFVKWNMLCLKYQDTWCIPYT